ncbi:hypothetical protein IQ265_28130 [Nodosilinea sp. LEGE 06152]|uniref:hypothetical protein n=1 Tax=Nodosilinea sp. LEGE 06152 TaxID=2777966 RepID=UPI00187FCDF7|nr:hypothetical protein [Nodosilinea sp. LEGE 06152]MBE9160661.1 hypothetical protein [Nodosilinea sp. LEGE 06152]
MLKTILARVAITGAVFLSAAVEVKAVEFPIIDHFCYWVNSSGQLLDLTSVCTGLEQSFIPPTSQAVVVSEDVTEEPVASPNSMQEAGYSLLLGRRATIAGISFDVWGKRGSDHIYYIWQGSNPTVRDNPDLVVQVDISRNSRVNDDYPVGCFYSSSSTCTGDRVSSAVTDPGVQQRIATSLKTMPPHRKWGSYAGSCLFPWQSASDGSRCGARAAVIREGGY